MFLTTSAMRPASALGKVRILAIRLSMPRVTLKEGMVLNFEPYVGKVGVGGIRRLENNHIVTHDGVEIYTTYPFDERLTIKPHALDATTGGRAEAANDDK